MERERARARAGSISACSFGGPLFAIVSVCVCVCWFAATKPATRDRLTCAQKAMAKSTQTLKLPKQTHNFPLFARESERGRALRKIVASRARPLMI